MALATQLLLLKTLIPNLHQPLLLLAVVLPMAMAASQNPLMSKPGCIDHCGNIPIPFPFGTSPDCFYNDNFGVTCNDTLQNSPKLLWWNTTIEITKISLDGQMTVMQYVSKDCVYPNGTEDKNNPEIKFADFTVNNTANKFTIVGCDSFGFIEGEKITERHFSTGCIAECVDREDLEEDASCMGTGCCQTAIPKGVWNVNVRVSSFGNYSEVRQVSNCTYGFLVEEAAFRFHPNNVTNSLWWSIGLSRIKSVARPRRTVQDMLVKVRTPSASSRKM